MLLGFNAFSVFIDLWGMQSALSLSLFSSLPRSLSCQLPSWCRVHSFLSNRTARKLKQVPWAAVQNTRSLHVKVTDNSLSVCIRWHEKDVLHFMWRYQVILLCSVWPGALVTTVDEMAVVMQAVVGHLTERLLNEHFFLSSLRKVTCTTNKIIT